MEYLWSVIGNYYFWQFFFEIFWIFESIYLIYYREYFLSYELSLIEKNYNLRELDGLLFRFQRYIIRWNNCHLLNHFIPSLCSYTLTTNVSNKTFYSIRPHTFRENVTRAIANFRVTNARYHAIHPIKKKREREKEMGKRVGGASHKNSKSNLGIEVRERATGVVAGGDRGRN